MSMPSNEFQPTNMKLARVYWYLIAGALGVFLLVRAIGFAQNWTRYADQQDPSAHPTNMFAPD